MPNLDLWFIVDFDIEDNKIYFIKKLKEIDNNYKIHKYEINFKDFSNDDPIVTNQKDEIANIVAHNISMYSDLCLHDPRLKSKLTQIFKFDLMTKYIITEAKLIHNIKSALIRMIDYLYLKQNDNLIQYFNLCRKINIDSVQNINNKDQKDHFDEEVLKIKENVQSHLESTIIKNELHSNVTLQLIETCHYILRYVYFKQIQFKNYYHLDFTIIFKFISLLLIVLEKLMLNTGYETKKKLTKKESKIKGFKWCCKTKKSEVKEFWWFCKKKTKKEEIKTNDDELFESNVLGKYNYNFRILAITQK